MGLFGLFDSSSIPQINAEGLRQKLQKEQLVLLDVREVFEHKAQNLAGSILIPLGELQRRIDELEKYREKEIVVYCRSGSRSTTACKLLQAKGFKATNLSGGIIRW